MPNHLKELIKRITGFLEIMLVQTKPLKRAYNDLAQSQYGQLIRMSSFYVYPMLFLPPWAAVYMADESDSVTKRVILCFIIAIGAFVTRSFGCVINDIFDKKFDEQVQRTKNRPLASGKITISEALAIAFIMGLLALMLLTLLPQRVLYVAAACTVMMIVYPLTKRFMEAPQAVLGLTWNAGVLIGWLSVSDSHWFQMVMLYVGFSLFTWGYDTIYACQDLQDDLKAGVKSFPTFIIKKGGNIKTVVWKLYKASLACIGIAGLGMGLHSTFFLSLAAGAYLLYNQLETCDIQNNRSCAAHFRKSGIFLFILFLGTIFGK